MKKTDLKKELEECQFDCGQLRLLAWILFFIVALLLVLIFAENIDAKF